jgi:cyclopropane-fatty-acyl-phospholipid synthase
MAEQVDLDYTYSTIDKIFRLSIGQNGDFSGAKYDGDFSLSLEEAQKRKHEYILDSLQIKEGSRILDMGCGWGPFLAFARNKGLIGKGLTLSHGQYSSCKRQGFDVHIKDCRTMTNRDFGKFDGLVSIGAFEHFCSVEDYQKGKQTRIYSDFFENAATLLSSGQRFFLQTMVFGKNMIPLEEIDIRASKDSDAYILALMLEQFPGSWLPYGTKMLEEAAAPHFRLVTKSSGRLDYIETIDQWRKRFRRFNLLKYLLYGSMLPQFLTSEAFRHRLAIFKISPNKVCFERELMDHYRFVFEKV